MDRAFESLWDSLERLLEWSAGLAQRKAATASHGQLKQRLDGALRELDAANAGEGVMCGVWCVVCDV